jgi:alanine-glyoxylate transaminase/(R)-3-amino-2-methylpropionate-pyruvate transaminase
MLPLLLCWVFELLLLLSQAFAGIVTVSVGHCHPEVVAAINKQNELLQHTTTIYLNNQIAEYAKELADKMPGNLKVIQPRL